jgi:hypothetical protein
MPFSCIPVSFLSLGKVERIPPVLEVWLQGGATVVLKIQEVESIQLTLVFNAILLKSIRIK